MTRATVLTAAILTAVFAAPAIHGQSTGASPDAPAAPPSGPSVTAAAAPGGLPVAAPATGGDRIAVTIFEFRSSLPNVSGRAATDMFKTALVQNGRFQVVERSRLNEGVLREKQLNAGGLTTGDAGQQLLRGAQYVFEGVVSEANAAESQRSSSISIAGVSLGSASATDSIAIDVRIIDAGNGDVLDAIVVKKPIKSSETSVGVSGGALASALGQRPRNAAMAPDVQSAQRKAEGADAALRAAIEEAVTRLASRFNR